MEKQLAEMPQAQRDMIMAQMGPQMEMMRGMASGGGMEIATEVHQIIANYCDKQDQITAMTTMGPVSVPTGGFAAMQDQASSVPGAAGAGAAAPADNRSGNSAAGAAAAAAGGMAGFALTEDEDVEVRPYYIDQEGIGVIRYSEPKGRTIRYQLAVTALNPDGDPPRELLVGQMGPYDGPDVAIYIGSLNMMNRPLDQLEIELYETEPYRPVVRFRPVVDADKAEGKAGCGTVSASGACSNRIAQ
jgi:hypothetical protein